MRRRWTILLVAVIVLLLAWVSVQQIWKVDGIRGTVVSNDRPLAGAIVRIKTTAFETRSDRDGRFELEGFPSRFSIHVTAWVDGYYIGGDVAFPWKRDVTISLQPYWTSDNSEYSWIPPKVEGRPAMEEILVRAGLPIAIAP